MPSPSDHDSTLPRAPSERPSAYRDETLRLTAQALGQIGETAPPVAGRYRLVRLHARGGMGEVYVAADEELQREVAVKRLQSKHADTVGQNRFVREARITGRLQHPGIVPVYGMVEDNRGRPCYAMRFVEGESLAEAIARHHAQRTDKPLALPKGASSAPILTLRQLLQRFVAICNAVAYAHSKGVVHRDLKPQNVLLGQFGETLIVDWGLAKIAERGLPCDERRDVDHSCPTIHAPIASADRSTDKPIGQPLRTNEIDESSTRAGDVIGTPTYMSPEQATAGTDDLSPATDIYSLGATLYTILTGVAPFPGDSAEAILARVRSGKFAAPREFNPAVPPALESICLKAMALERADRYASALDLAADVERWLADEPISAYRGPWSESVCRWARHHRTLVGALTATVFAVLASLIVTTFLLTAAREREAQARAFAEAQERAAQAERDAAAQQRDDARIQRDVAAQQRDQAQKNFRLARDAVRAMLSVTGATELRDVPLAETVRRQLLERALGFHEQFVKTYGDDPSVRWDAVQARMDLGDVDRLLGRAEEARQVYTRAAADLAILVKEFPNDPGYRDTLASVHNNLSLVLSDLKRPDEAEKAVREVIRIQTELSAKFPNSLRHRCSAAKAYHNLGNYIAKTRPQEAETAYATALKVGHELLAQEARNPEYRSDQARHHISLGQLLAATKRPQEAEEQMRAALGYCEELVTQVRRSADYRQDYGTALHALGDLCRHTNRSADAIGWFRKSADVRARLAADFPYVPLYQNQLVYTGLALYDLLREAKQLRDAEAAQKLVIVGRQRLVAIDPNNSYHVVHLGGAICNLGVLLEDDHRGAAALPQYTRAIGVLEPVVSGDSNNLLARKFLRNCYWNRARQQRAQNRPGEAIADFERTASLDDDDRSRGWARLSQAEEHLKLNDYARAASAAELALGLEGLQTPHLLNAARTLAACAVLVARAGSGEDLDRVKLRDQYVTRSMTLLTRLKADPAARTPDHVQRLETDPAYAAVREHADFPKLLAELKGEGN